MVIESSLALPVKAPVGNWIFRVENILTPTITTASIYTLNESFSKSDQIVLLSRIKLLPPLLNVVFSHAIL